MRTQKLFTLLVCCCSCVFFASNAYSITRERATEIALQDALGFSTIGGSNVFIARNLIPPNAILRCLSRTYTSPAHESWLFFSDDEPLANWMHPARIVFVDSITGAYNLIDERCPPEPGSPGFVLEYDTVVINVEIPSYRRDLIITPLTTAISNRSNVPPRLPPESKYAVLISGGWNDFSNHERYYQDLKETYTMLKNVYGYRDTNIYVLCADGDADGNDSIEFSDVERSMDLDEDGRVDLYGAAIVANVDSVFDLLNTRMNGKDLLFVFTTDHGNNSNPFAPVFDEGSLTLWSEEMRDDQFAAAVNKITDYAYQIFLFEQCFSGDMINDLEGRNRVIATAARWDEFSWGRVFSGLWIAAADGRVPAADVDNDSNVSVLEAFLYAEANDDEDEHPQYYENWPGLGGILTLSGPIDTIAPEIRVQINTASSDPVTNHPRVDFRLLNEDPERFVSLRDIEIRYWYATAPAAQQAAYIDYAELREPYRNITGATAMEIVPVSQGTQTHYLRLTFTDTALVIAPGGANGATIQTRFHKTDWSLYDQRDDWSHIETGDFTDAPKVTAYYKGILIWGTEPPEGGVPHTADLKAHYSTYASSPQSNTMYINIRILNTGGAAVDLSSVSAKYWYAKEGSCPEQVHIDWAGRLPSGQAITSSTAGTIVPAGTGGQTNALRLSFTSAAGSLEPQNYVEAHVRVNKTDWSEYIQTNDYSFGPNGSFVDWNKVVLYVNNIPVWGTEP